MVKNVTSTKEVKMRRDFTKSNKEYFTKNHIALICVSVFLILGILVAIIFGFNGNFEINGYNEFSISATANKKTYSNIYKQAEEVVNCYGGDYDSYSIMGEGDNTKIVIRYNNDLTIENQTKVNKDIAEALEIDIIKISEHKEVKPVVEAKDYVFTATAILLLVVAACIFAYVRYNGASSMAILLGCIIGSLGFMSLSAILRLSIGMSYFAMLVALNTIIIYFALTIFENMHKSNWLGNGDYETAISSSLKETRIRIMVFSIAILLLGVLFVAFAPAEIKYVSLNIMFIAVVALAVAWYVIPFAWSALITFCRKREYKVKVNKED